MRKILLLFTLALFTVNLSAQEFEEPEFIGECLLIKSDGTAVPLEKQLSQSRTVASTGLIMTGIGKVRNQIQIDGCCSSIKIHRNDDIKIIIKNSDNLSDPLSIIKIFKFEKKKKFRRAEVAAVSSLGSAKRNNLDYVSFTGKKYGTSSYILTLGSLEPGEYGITISNPNNIDEKQTVVSAFAVVD